MRLQTKVLLTLVPLTVLPLLGTGWFAYSRLHQSLEQRADEQLDTLVNQVALNAKARIASLVSDTKVMASSGLIRRYLSTKDDAERYQLLYSPLLGLLDGYLAAFPHYSRIQLFLRDGSEDARSEHQAPSYPNDQRVSQGARVGADNRLGDVHLETIGTPANGDLALLATRPLMVTDRSVDPLLGQSTLQGYLAVTMPLRLLAGRRSSAPLGPHGLLFFADRNGLVLDHSIAEQVGTVLPQPLWNSLIEAPGDAGPARGTFQGRLSILKATPAAAGIYAVGVMPVAEVNAAGRELGETVLGATLVTVGASVLLLVVVLRSLVLVPVRRLHAATEEVRRGNLTPSIEVRGQDELGELAHAFLAMGRHLCESTKEIRRLAYHDALTGLPNRQQFLEQLAETLKRARRQSVRVAVLFIDLDNFKRVNDSLGHTAGDELLKEISSRLSCTLRASDTVARPRDDCGDGLVSRLGGDEFIILLAEVTDPQVPARVARRVLDVIAKPYRIARRDIQPSASVGISLFPDDGEDPTALVRGADTAMYHAKEQGRNNFQFCSQALNEEAARRLTIESRLRGALETGRLALHYQPIIDLGLGTIIGFEALIRWTDDELGPLSPQDFVGIAEEGHLILALTEWTLAEATRQARAWQQQGLPACFVAVNVSGAALRRRAIDRMIGHALASSGLSADRLQIELTETSLHSTGDETVQRLRAVRALGVQIALDDFGTGYSSLSYLHRFPIDKVKIDRSFVSDLIEGSGDDSIVVAMLAMAQALNLTVTAEGIETQAQLGYLKQRGCDHAQGFLFGRAVAAEDAGRWLADGVPEAAARSVA